MFLSHRLGCIPVQLVLLTCACDEAAVQLLPTMCLPAIKFLCKVNVLIHFLIINNFQGTRECLLGFS